jgi:hypothetical protein
MPSTHRVGRRSAGLSAVALEPRPGGRCGGTLHRCPLRVSLKTRGCVPGDVCGANGSVGLTTRPADLSRPRGSPLRLGTRIALDQQWLSRLIPLIRLNLTGSNLPWPIHRYHCLWSGMFRMNLLTSGFWLSALLIRPRSLPAGAMLETCGSAGKGRTFPVIS